MTRPRGSQRADVVYGVQPVREALRGRRTVHHVYVGERRARADWSTSSLQIAANDELDRLAGSPDHQGVVAVVDPYPYVDADDLLAVRRPLIVALDEITDPQNVGAIARAAECAGATGLVLPRHRACHVTPAVARASAGAIEHLAIAIVPNLADWLVESRRAGTWSFATDAEASLAYTDADLVDGTIIVIGSEGRGVRPRVRASCDEAIAIPLLGAVRSLNAGVATAVVLFEAARQRAAASMST